MIRYIRKVLHNKGNHSFNIVPGQTHLSYMNLILFNVTNISRLLLSATKLQESD